MQKKIGPEISRGGPPLTPLDLPEPAQSPPGPPQVDPDAHLSFGFVAPSCDFVTLSSDFVIQSIHYRYSIDTVSILYRYCIDTVSILYRYCIDIGSIQPAG